MSGLLQPDPESLAVALHPNRELGDLVAVNFTDGATGKDFALVLPLAVTQHVADLLATAVQSPRIGAAADQIRAHQRNRG